MTEATDAAPAALLATDCLTRRFGGLVAVREVSLALLPGELHAVIGPNGAGKSTLVNLLAGELMPSAGRLLLAGTDITGTPMHRMAGLGIARSFQRTNILGALPAFENVRLAAQAVHLPASRLGCFAAGERDLAERARVALDRVGLGSLDDRPAAVLSHGAQRQLEIAMALAAAPKVLLLDEPMAGMGPEESERIAVLLKELAHDHAVLLIEHDMDFVFSVADRLTVLVEGQVLASGPPAEIRANSAVQRAYLGEAA